MNPGSGRQRLTVVAIAIACILATFAGSATAVAVPTLTSHRAYEAQTPNLRVALISHSPTVIDAARVGGGAGQYTTGYLFFNCPAVSTKAVVDPGFAKITLKKTDGVYAFSLNYTVDDVNAGYLGQSSTTLGQVHVHFTGRVTSPTTITGTAQLTGVPCSTSAYSYVARINAADTKYLSPNA